MTTAKTKFPIYVFDAYGTLFDVHSAASRYADEIGDRWSRLSEIWRQKHLEYTWIYAQTGRHTTFWLLAEASLVTASAAVGGISDDLKEKLLGAYRSLNAYSEVAEVLRHLRAGGARTAILTNGDPELIAQSTASAGITDLLDDALTVHAVGVFKPDMRCYQIVCDAYGCAPADVSFQSSNRWDAVGANVFGFKTLWVNRGGAPTEYPETPPDRIASDLRVLLDD